MSLIFLAQLRNASRGVRGEDLRSVKTRMPELVLFKKSDRHREFFSQEAKGGGGWAHLDCAAMLIPFRLQEEFLKDPE